MLYVTQSLYRYSLQIKQRCIPLWKRNETMHMLIFFSICHNSFVLFQSLQFVHIMKMPCNGHAILCPSYRYMFLSTLGNGNWLTDPRPTIYFFHKVHWLLKQWVILLQWLAHWNNKSNVFKQDNIAINC